MTPPTAAGEPLTIPAALVGQRTMAITEELTPRICMAFAAGVDDPNPVYFDDTRPEGILGHPGLAFRLQWQSHYTPGRPFDVRAPMWRSLLHAGSDIRYRRPLRAGDVLTCQGRTVALRPIKPGVLWIQRYTMVDAAGATVVELDHSAIVRDARIEGGERDESDSPSLPELAATGAEPVWSAATAIGATAPHVYTECADIWNPIHTERAVALAAGLPDIVLHGTATLAIAAREIINRELDGAPGRLERLAGQFRAMVLPGHPLTIRCLERRRQADGGVAIFFEALNHEGQPAIDRGVVVAEAAG